MPSTRFNLNCIIFLSSFVFAFGAFAQPFSQARTERLSFGTFTGAVEGNAAATNPKMSKNARFVVFQSTASNLVDTSSGVYNGFNNINGTRSHIYLADRQAGTLELITINAAGTNAAPFDATNPVVSSDGRYVAYVATTTGAQAVLMNSAIDGNLGDGNSCLRNPYCHVNYWVDGTHIWIRDRLANKNFIASQVTIPVKAQALSNGIRATTTVKRLQAFGDDDCQVTATPGVDTLIPVMETLSIRMAQGILTFSDPITGPQTISAASAANPNMGGDGRFVVFDSTSNYLAGVASDDLLYTDPICNQDFNLTANDGLLPLSYIRLPDAYYLDNNGTTRDVFVRDGEDLSVQIASYGCQYHGAGGCSVQGNQDAVKGAISDDGTKVTWQSASGNLLDLDFNTTTDVFMSLRDSLNGEVESLERISNATNRVVASNGASTEAAISADGRYIAFQSAGTNIITGDTNAKTDIFVYDTEFFTMVRCVNSSSTQGDGDSLLAKLAGAGEYVAFHSDSTNFGASSGVNNIFVGTLSKNTIGRLTSCTVTLASPGSAGTGANAAATSANVGIVPISETVNGVLTRKRTSAVSYQSAATNLHTGSADANAVADIFQAPTCSAEDASGDQDGDGTSDCFDQCWQDALKVEDNDTDSDGVADCEDGCVSDPQKTTPGVCGCGEVDSDSDADGTPDCTDQCPTDPDKTAPGVCGCGQPDEDQNGNGEIDCVESTNPTPTPGGPTATPTPGGSTPTPAATATPTPTATPVFNEYSPTTPSLEKVSNRTLLGTITTDGLTGYTVKRFEIERFRKAIGSSTTTKATFRLASSKRTITFRNLLTGTYQIRFRAVRDLNGSEQKTKWSEKSRKVTLRR